MKLKITENSDTDNNIVYEGVVRIILKGKDGRNDYGFICEHTCQEINKDIFFSLGCVETKEKIDRDDNISFMLKKDELSGRCWATNIRKLKEKGEE